MPFKLSRTSVLLYIAIFLSVILVMRLGVGPVGEEVAHFFITGRIPGTESYVSIEALLGGMVFGSWLIVTFNFTLAAILKIVDELNPDHVNQKKIEEIAL